MHVLLSTYDKLYSVLPVEERGMISLWQNTHLYLIRERSRILSKAVEESTAVMVSVWEREMERERGRKNHHTFTTWFHRWRWRRGHTIWHHNSINQHPWTRHKTARDCWPQLKTESHAQDREKAVSTITFCLTHTHPTRTHTHNNRSVQRSSSDVTALAQHLTHFPGLLPRMEGEVLVGVASRAKMEIIPKNSIGYSRMYKS